jgi:hypothetical protein
MIKAIGNSGREKAPTPKSVMVFKGIKGLVASGPGTKKTPVIPKVRPEQNEGAKIPQDAMKKTPTMTPAKTAMKTVKSGRVSVAPGIRPEGAIKRDSASVIKP